jgi:hypothetical protein
MNGSGQIAAIRAVQTAAMKLTLACAEIVGPVDIALGMTESAVLGEAIPKAMKRQIRNIDRRSK